MDNSEYDGGAKAQFIVVASGLFTVSQKRKEVEEDQIDATKEIAEYEEKPRKTPESPHQGRVQGDGEIEVVRVWARYLGRRTVPVSRP